MIDPRPPLIRLLCDGQHSPLVTPAGGPIDLVETHISWVVLAGEFAWKIKKPVVLPFLDFSSVDRRRAACAAELRLNRRFAPGLYLDLVDFDGEPAVKMRRFPETARLDHVCARGELRPEQLSALAATLARIHAAAPAAPAATRFGAPAAVLAPAIDNITELRKHLHGAWCALLDQLADWTRNEHARLEPVFVARKAAGAVRECHGDLHLGNLVLLADESAAAADGRIVPFDCIEFNDDFRWIDVASEIAFLLVDLLDHGQAGLATWMLDAWLAETGDFDALRVLRFYMTYRVLVRAKVAAIRAAQTGADLASGRGPEGLAQVRKYLTLAAAITAPPRPQLTITHGLSGCGKSQAAAARLLAATAVDTLRVRSDVERKRLFGLAANESSRSATAGGIYTADAHTRTYARLAELAGLALTAGWSVIVDAAFLQRRERDDFRLLAADHGAPFSILAPQAPLAELARRIVARQHAGQDASEATLEVLARQQDWLEPLAADEPAHAR